MGPKERRTEETADAGQAEQLLDAVTRDDLAKAAALLKSGADAGARDKGTGLTALMIAAGHGNAALVRELLAHGADVHQVDGRAGASALHKACQSEDVATVRLLAEAGSLLNLQTAITGHTPLVDAVWYSRVATVEYLLSLETGLGQRTSYGFELDDHVNYALKTNSGGKEKLLAIQELIRKRRESDKAKASPLMAAVLAGDLDGVRRELGKGADLEYRAPMLNNFDDGYTPLLAAARDGRAEIVKELLAAGADANATDAIFQAVPLHKATYHGHLAVTRLLAGHPGVDLDFQGATNGYTPLHDALWHGYGDCAAVLVGAGARLDIRAHDGTNALDIALRTFGDGHEVVRLIRGKMNDGHR